MAATLLSLRALRRSPSSSSSVDPASTAALTKRAPVSFAARSALTPPARVSTTRASPPSAGSIHRALTGSASGVSGSGRAELKYSSPPAANTAPASPLALRVMRRACFCPAGSSSHRAVPYSVPLAFSVATVVTSRLPSGLNARPATRGIAR